MSSWLGILLRRYIDIVHNNTAKERILKVFVTSNLYRYITSFAN